MIEGSERQVAGVDLLLNAAHFNETEARHRALLLEQCFFLGGTIPELMLPLTTFTHWPRLQWGSDGEIALRPRYEGPPYLAADFHKLMTSLEEEGKVRSVCDSNGLFNLPTLVVQTSTPSTWIGDVDMHMLHALELVSYCFPNKDETL
jgi:hypothetical protein